MGKARVSDESRNKWCDEIPINSLIESLANVSFPTQLYVYVTTLDK